MTKNESLLILKINRDRDGQKAGLVIRKAKQILITL